MVIIYNINKVIIIGVLMKRRLISLLCLLLALLMLLPTVIACKDNGDDDDSDGSGEESGGGGAEDGGQADGGNGGGEPDYMKNTNIKLEIATEAVTMALNSGDTAAYEQSGLKSDTSVTRDGAASSGKWENFKPTNITFPSETDITGYETINIWMYSEKATGSRIHLCVYCQGALNSEQKPTTAYGGYSILIDFTGWKLISISLGSLSNGYNPDYTKVSSIKLCSTGWNTSVVANTSIYIDSIFYGRSKTTVPTNEIGAYNYDHIIDTLVDNMVGDRPMSEMSDTDKAKLQRMINNAKSAQSDLIRDPNADTPYSYDMSTTENITSNHNRIYQMALGYAIEGGELYHNEHLLADIVYAMDKLHENYFRDKSLHEYPKRNNWWNWVIGSPQHIVNTIMLCRDALTEEQINKWLTPVNKYVPGPSMTMANLIDIDYVLIAAGAIQRDPVKIVRARDSAYECCFYVTKGDGFYTDGSFVQHDVIAYTGSYGPIVLDKLSQLALATDGTCFRYDDAIFEHMYDWTVQSYTPLMYHGAFFGLVRGRSIYRTSTDVSLGVTAVRGMLRLTRLLKDTAKSNELKEILLEYYAYNEEYYESALTQPDLAVMHSIKADTSVSARVGYTMAKIFAMMDRAIAHKDGYAVGISMSSSRIAKYEAINEENRRGWYTGDGMLYVYTDVNDYEPAFWKNVNMLRQPGTTVTNAPRAEENINYNHAVTQYDFVGGASLEGSMVAAMEFESAAPKLGFNSTLVGKKGWFVMGDKIICLGGGITSKETAYTTETIIENRRTNILKVNGESVTATSGTVSGELRIYLGGFGGIYVPNGTVKYNKVTNNGVTFTELYFEHGTKFTDQKYTYVLLPNMTEAEIASYTPDFEILLCGKSIMAVKDNETGISAYIFYSSGTYGNINVSSPCVFMVSDDTVALADPSQKHSDITLKMNGKTYKFTDLQYGATQTKPLQ